MILSKDLVVRCLKDVETKGRKLDYYLIKNLFDSQQSNILKELRHFQNEDGGFGHGLEPDVRMPGSSVVCTDEAVMILEELKDSSTKAKMIEQIVHYYESVFMEEREEWELVPPEVDKFPRAVWWNYSGVGEFSYGNPNPQIIGFLFKHQKFLKKLDIEHLVNKVMDYMVNVFPNEAKKHSIMSSIIFYNHVDLERQKVLFPILKDAVDNEIAFDHWEEYCLQPYEIFSLNRDFLMGHEQLLEMNLEYQFDRLQKGLIMPNWQWYQFEAEFEKAKWEWAGYLTFNIIKVLLA